MDARFAVEPLQVSFLGLAGVAAYRHSNLGPTRALHQHKDLNTSTHPTSLSAFIFAAWQHASNTRKSRHAMLHCHFSVFCNRVHTKRADEGTSTTSFACLTATLCCAQGPPDHMLKDLIAHATHSSPTLSVHIKLPQCTAAAYICRMCHSCVHSCCC